LVDKINLIEAYNTDMLNAIVKYSTMYSEEENTQYIYNLLKKNNFSEEELDYFLKKKYL